MMGSGRISTKSGDVTQAPAEDKTADHGTNAQSALASPSPNAIIRKDSESVNAENGAVGAAEKVTFLLPVLWLRSNWWILSAETIKWNDCINMKLFYKYFLHFCVYRCILMVIFWTRSKEMEE